MLPDPYDDEAAIEVISRPHARLSQPAPTREWVKQEDGTWFSRPWSPQAVLDVKESGGWFQPGKSVFENPVAGDFAEDSPKKATPRIPHQYTATLPSLPIYTVEDLLDELMDTIHDND